MSAAAGLADALRVFLPLLLPALALWALSALSFRWVLGGAAAAWARGPHAQRVFTVLRTPGNVLHEASHAAATLAAGYRVAELRFCFDDPARRGLCRPGAPWAPWAVAPVRDLLSGLAPLAGGAAALQAMAWAASVRLPAVDPLGPPGDAALALAGAVRALDWSEPRTWAFLGATVLVGAEAHPSGTDLRIAAPPLAAVALALGLLGAASGAWPVLLPAVGPVLSGAAAATAWLASYAAVSAAALATALAVVAPAGALAVRLTRR